MLDGLPGYRLSISRLYTDPASTDHSYADGLSRGRALQKNILPRVCTNEKEPKSLDRPGKADGRRMASVLPCVKYYDRYMEPIEEESSLFWEGTRTTFTSAVYPATVPHELMWYLGQSSTPTPTPARCPRTDQQEILLQGETESTADILEGDNRGEQSCPYTTLF